jgi:O-antigen/teichoic acid export membrane protein
LSGDPVVSRRAFPTFGRSRTFWQASIFASSNILVALLAVVSTAILARHLGANQFGNYSFAIASLVFIAMIFEFGLFAPAARLAAVAEPSRQRRIVGAAFLLYLPVGLAFCLTIVALSYRIDDWFPVNVGTALRIAAPVAFAIPFTQIAQQLSQGVDSLHIASITAVVMQVIFLGALVLAVLAGGFGLTTAVILRCVAVATGAVAAAVWLRPALRSARDLVVELVHEARVWGFHLYIGRLLSIGTYNMDVLMLGGLAGSTPVGLYTLAGSVAAAAGLPVLGMTTALFAPLARADRIGSRPLTLSAALGLTTSLAAWLLAGPFIRVTFGEQYVSAAHLVLPLALAQAVRGVTGVYNTFLQAHGRGRELRNAGLILTGSNLALNVSLIPPFGASGAAWASLGALLANLIGHIVFYRRVQSETTA